MAMAFNMLRSNDLIWSYVVSNYLKGKPPSSFDLLHWNSDATRMPAANHSSICATAIWTTACPPAAWSSTTRCSISRR